MTFQNKRFAAILLTAAMLLLLPFVAMQFTKEVAWSGSDFIIAGILLFGTGGLIELALRTIKTRKARMIVCLVILAVLCLVWVELAVGFFGTPFAGN